jgi:hypothetical protein
MVSKEEFESALAYAVIGSEQKRTIRDYCQERTRRIGQLRNALDYLLEQTVDQDLKHGIALTEGEADARQQALEVLGRAEDV